jgi:hypothetical protein
VLPVGFALRVRVVGVRAATVTEFDPEALLYVDELVESGE